MKKIKYFVLSACLIAAVAVLYNNARANGEAVTVVDSADCNIDIIDNDVRDSIRDIMVNVNDVKAGRRIVGFSYCLKSTDCNDEANYIDVQNYNAENVISSFQNGIGNTDMTYSLKVPQEDIMLKAVFTDFEPMNISYAKYNLSTTDEHRYRDVYVDGYNDRENYDDTFTNIVTGYKGGDIILPSGCTDNGCLIKITFAKDDYDAIMARLNNFNQNINMDDTDKLFLELGAFNNHLSELPVDTIMAARDGQNLYIEETADTRSIYLIVNKFFSETNRSDFVIADNKNRILSEEYIGLKYSVDRKYFDEGNEFGFLSFNEFNNYTKDATIFYGTPIVKLAVDEVIPVSLTAGGDSSGMGVIKHPYTKIVSGDNTKYPINNNFELTINSFYEQDYTVPLILQNDLGQTVQNITLTLSRFAFGGNAGSLLLVDGDGINCRQGWMHPDCSEGNIYISTQYRGLFDTFYSTGVSRNIEYFEIGTFGDEKVARLTSGLVYERDESFNPWATAIFYHDDMVVATRSFNLGELVKIGGISEEAIPESVINGKINDNNHNLITDYDSSDYSLFGYAAGYEIPINKVKYFDVNSYERGTISYTLILASKEEIIDNNINRIALFLTNGELKSDEARFPELTYGVGEGKIFEIDGRLFEELGGEQ